MRVYYSVEEVPEIKNAVLTLGTFDGVHLGHQEIINQLKESASRIDGETVLFTFHPHPRMVLHPDDHNLELIQDIDRRISCLEKAGIDHLILHPFTLDFARQTATEFVRNVLVNKLNIKILTIGYNHHFGRNREGNIDLLRELAPVYNFEVEEIPALRKEELSISSTKIRNALKNGDIKIANDYLGAPFCFSGIVQDGDKIGRTIGFPTANIGELDETQLVPGNGVYAVHVKINEQSHQGMLNIGYRPTVSEEKNLRIEVNLFDFGDSIYGTKIELHVIEKVRDEQAFQSIDELKEQLTKDEISCKHILDRSSARV